MKLSKRTSGHFFLFLLLGIIIGSLSWELLERIITLTGSTFTLAVGPIGFDTGVLEVWMQISPGTFLGAGAGLFLFKKA